MSEKKLNLIAGVHQKQRKAKLEDLESNVDDVMKALMGAGLKPTKGEVEADGIQYDDMASAKEGPSNEAKAARKAANKALKSGQDAVNSFKPAKK